MTYLDTSNDYPIDGYISMQAIKGESFDGIFDLFSRVGKVISSVFQQLQLIYDIWRNDSQASLSQAYKIADYGSWVLKPETLKLNWKGLSPTSENNIDGTHVFRVSDSAFVIEHQKIGEGAGKTVNQGLLVQIDKMGKTAIQEVAILHPRFYVGLGDIISEERDIASLRLNNKHLESNALYTGRTYDPNLFQTRVEKNDNTVPVINQYVIKPMLKRTAANLTSIREALQVGLDVSKGLKYLHSRDLIHRDIKPDNIMMIDKRKDKVTAKLIDMGQIIDADGKPHTVKGTTGYLPPAVYGTNVQTKAGDMYALGVTLHMMIGQFVETPENFSPKNPKIPNFEKQLTKFSDREASILRGMHALANKLTDEDPVNRPAAATTYAQLKAIKELVGN